MPTAEQYTDPLAAHAEGPVWSPAWGGLAWVDMLAGDILRVDPAGSVDRWPVGPVAAAFRPRRDGGVVVATEHEFVVAEEFGGPTRAVASVLSDPGVRFNDGGCDPAGGFWCGTMAYDESPGRGELFRLSPDGAVRRILSDVTISNGLAWTADGSLAYYIDTPTGRIDVFDADGAAGLADRRPFVAIEPADGHPDGLTLDAEDRVWVALWGGAAVRCYDPGGSLVEQVELPVPKVTACTFGGPELDELYITTSREGEPDGTHRAAGAVYRYRPGVRGHPVLPFVG
jgi:sugar lactone lactonase YvrE